MEDKINVAKLLKDCPEGMELDCTLFSRPLKYSGFEGFQDAYPIRTVAENGEIIWFTKEGCAHNNMYSKCVIFPKGKTTWEGFIPPCTFKPGDVLISQAGNMVLFSHIDSKNIVHYHCILPTSGSFRIEKNTSTGVGEYRDCILANEHQKQRMYDKIKSARYKYNQNTNKLEKILEFKDGDIVAAPIYVGGTWMGIFKQCNDTTFEVYCSLTAGGEFAYTSSKGHVLAFTRLATEEEKQKLFQTIKDNGYKWNEEKKCLDKLPKFKDGDIVAYDNAYSPSTVFIYRNDNPDWNTSYFVGLSGITGKFYKEPSGALMGYNPNVRFATKEEKERLFKAIKDNGYKWNAETKTLEKIIKPKFKVGDEIVNILRKQMGASATRWRILEVKDDKYIFSDGSYMCISNQDNWELIPDKFDITTLKPFDQVLVRDTINNKWKIEFFEKFNATVPYPFYCMVNAFKQCVPYKGNEHLLDTKDECSDYYKTW